MVETVIETLETVVETVVETVAKIYRNRKNATEGISSEPLQKDIYGYYSFYNGFYNSFYDGFYGLYNSFYNSNMSRQATCAHGATMVTHLKAYMCTREFCHQNH